MTLTRYSGGYEEIFRSAILWWQGKNQTITGFPIIPAGVTVTPAGTFANDLNLGTNVTLKTFDGSTNYLSLTDSASWNIFGSDFAICTRIRFTDISATRSICGQYADVSNRWSLTYDQSVGKLYLYGCISGSGTFNYQCTFSPSINTWYDIVVERSGSSCLMFIDGISQTVNAVTAFTGTTDVAAVLTIGLANTLYHYGNIKDLMIFTRALSQPEIALVMRKTNPVSGEDNFYPTLSGVRSVE